MQLSALDLNLLPVLHALLETQSVQQTARRVGLSPSAVSHALSRLRDQLGDPLLVRAGRRLVATPRAQAIRPQLAASLSALQQSLATGRPFDPATSTQRFVFACTDHAELSVVHDLGRTLLREGPGIDLHTRPPRDDVYEGLRAGTLDFAVGLFREPASDLDGWTLFDERFVVLLRSGHPALELPWTPETYAALDHVLVAPRGDPRGRLDDQLEALGLKRRVARVVGTFLVAPFLVADGDLVVTLPRRAARPLVQALGLVEREPPDGLQSGFPMRLLWHRSRREDAGHRWIRGCLGAGDPTP